MSKKKSIFITNIVTNLPKSVFHNNTNGKSQHIFKFCTTQCVVTRSVLSFRLCKLYFIHIVQAFRTNDVH